MTIPTVPQDYHLYHNDLPASVVRKDYHRFYLDPHTLPSPRIVGVLACQRDPYLRSLETRILRAEPAGDESIARSRGVTAQMANGEPVNGDGKGNEKGKAKGKAGKGGKGDVAGKSNGGLTGGKKEEKADKKGEMELWQLELEDTVLFPEGKLAPRLPIHTTTCNHVIRLIIHALVIQMYSQVEDSQTIPVS